MIAEGEYRVTPGVAFIDNTSKGTYFVGVPFTAEEERIIWRGWLSEKTMERTLKSLKLMGWTGTDPFTDLRGIGSRDVQIVIRHEEYEGKVRAAVAFVNSIRKKPVAPPAHLVELAKRIAAGIEVPAKEPEDDIAF